MEPQELENAIKNTGATLAGLALIQLKDRNLEPLKKGIAQALIAKMSVEQKVIANLQKVLDDEINQLQDKINGYANGSYTIPDKILEELRGVASDVSGRMIAGFMEGVK